MIYKIFGSILIIAGCGSIGFQMAFFCKKEEYLLREMVGILDYMICQLQYRLTPLPELCRKSAENTSVSLLKNVLSALADELDKQISPNVVNCMFTSLEKVPDMPKSLLTLMESLGHTLGRFDIDGQVKDLEGIKAECLHKLDAISANQANRIKTYRVLGLCAGTALTILMF